MKRKNMLFLILVIVFFIISMKIDVGSTRKEISGSISQSSIKLSDTSYNETFDSGLTYNWSAYNELGLRDSDWQISCGGYTIVPPVQGMYSFNFIDLYLPNDTYALEVDFKNVVDGGILFGGRDASNFVVLGVLSNEIYIQNREGNVWTTRYAIVLLDQYGPTNFHLKLVIENQNAIKFYLNGTLKLDTTFVLFSPVGRQVGLFMNRNYSGEAFDNFTYYASLPSQDNFPIPINRTITLISISVISCLVILFTISTKMKERFLKQKKLVATKASDSNKAAFSSHAVSIIDEDYSLKHYPAFFLNQYSIPQNKQSLRDGMILISLNILFFVLVNLYYYSPLWNLDFVNAPHLNVIFSVIFFNHGWAVALIFFIDGGRTSTSLRRSYFYAFILTVVAAIAYQIATYIYDARRLSIFYIMLSFELFLTTVFIAELIEQRISKIGTIHLALTHLVVYDFRKDVKECGIRLLDAIESYFSYGGMMIGNKEELLDGFLKKIVFRDQEMMIQIKDLMKKEHFDKFIELDGKPNFFAVRNLADLRVRNSDPLAFQWFTALATILFGDIKFTPKTAALFFKRHIRVIISVVSSMISFLPVVVRFITS